MVKTLKGLIHYNNYSSWTTNIDTVRMKTTNKKDSIDNSL